MALCLLAIGLVACQAEVPTPGTKDYGTAVSAFYTGVAALQVGENSRAEQQMKRVAKLAPGEPAAWANRGVLAAQQNDLEAAAHHFERARSLAPDHAPFWLLSGLLERERGNYDRARSHLERATEIDSTNAPALYALAQVSEQEGGETALQDASPEGSTDPAEMDRCPECGSVKLRSKPGATQANSREGSTQCVRCKAHLTDPLPPRAAFDVSEPVCPACRSWRLRTRVGGGDCPVSVSAMAVDRSRTVTVPIEASSRSITARRRSLASRP